MNTKLINTMTSMIFISLVGLCILIISAFVKLPVNFEPVRYMAILIGAACLGYAWYVYRHARKQAELLDLKADEWQKKVSENSVNNEDLKSRTENIRKLLSNDQWFAERVDVAYFRRDEFGNRFMPGSVHGAGEITAWGDTMTIEEIRKAVDQALRMQLGGGTIEVDKRYNCFQFDKKRSKREKQ